MGRFSDGLVIKKADFVNAFNELMKKRGYVPCDESAAELSYFVEQGREWAAISGADYTDNPGHSRADMALIAKELNVPVFSVGVVDSDFAILNVNGSEVIVGDGSGYGIEDAPSADRADWEPFLTNGTFEELTDIWENDEVFVEDALCKSAPLFGIDPPTLIVPDFRDFSEDSDNINVTALYFKKANGQLAETEKCPYSSKGDFIERRFACILNIKSYDFVNAFTELMKKRGFVRCDENMAGISYYVEQGEKWASLTGEWNCIDNPYPETDMELIAKEMNTPVFYVGLQTYNYAILKINESEVMLGDPRAFGIKDIPSPDRAVWEPFLTNGTFEELMEIWENNEVSVDDALRKTALFFGIEPLTLILPDFRIYPKDLDNKNISVLYFKKAAAKGP